MFSYIEFMLKNFASLKFFKVNNRYVNTYLGI